MRGFLTLLLALGLHAEVIFSDGFEADSFGLNVVPDGWAITGGGTIDVVDFGCHSGRVCVDLDGTSGLAGTLAHSFNAATGELYTLTFWLNNSGRGDNNTVTVTLGSTFTDIAVPSDLPPTAFTLDWISPSTTLAMFSFHNLGGDNIGAILDDVVVASREAAVVPEPAPILLLAAGLASVALRRRTTC